MSLGIRCLGLAFFLAAVQGAPKIGVVYWPQRDNPIWGPRLAEGLRVLVEADTLFGGAPYPDAYWTRMHGDFSPRDMEAGQAKSVALEWGADDLVHLELVQADPVQKVIRERWMPWKAEESWSFPLRLTVWDGRTGRVAYRGVIDGETTRKGNRFWLIPSFEKMSFMEKQKRRDAYLDTSLAAAKDTLAGIIARLPANAP